MSRPRKSEVEDALLHAVGERREAGDVLEDGDGVADVVLAMPIQLVAQKTKLCSLAMLRTLPALTSLAVPSSPWPYSDGRAGLAIRRGVTAECGTTQVKFAVMSGPARTGRPSAPWVNREPGAPVPVR